MWININNDNIVQESLTELSYRRIDTDPTTVFRWDTRSYKDIFKHGFQSWSQVETPNSVYYNLYDYVHHGGKPLNFDRFPFERHVFCRRN